jgi:hypothetical protein
MIMGSDVMISAASAAEIVRLAAVGMACAAPMVDLE